MTSTPSRRQLVADALDASQRPVPIKPLPLMDSPLELLGETIRQEAKAGRIKPGGMTSIIKDLPHEVKLAVIAAVDACGNQRELGKYGMVDGVAEHFEVDRPLLETITDCVETDYICHELQSRRGSDGDADDPMPELTRRDHLSAAFDAHSSEE